MEGVEGVIETSLDGSIEPQRSYINRVYGLRDRGGRRWIAKFYRPGRWDEEAIRQEHRFVELCHGAQCPALPALVDGEGDSLSTLLVEDEDGNEYPFHFALYPFVGGPSWEPAGEGDWRTLGRIVAGMHGVAVEFRAPGRPRLHPEGSFSQAVVELSKGVIHPDVEREFLDLCESLIPTLADRFEGVPTHPIHGDFHRGNLLRGADGGPLIIDFDDMAVGPAVQDLWLLLPGRRDDAPRELASILEGYQEVRAFDPAYLDLIEPLRLMRMVSYLAWQARQRADAQFLRAFPDWGSRPFWIIELEDLRDQARVIGELP